MARLEQVHRGDPARPAIVFVHGLGGDMFDTWLGPGASRDDCWLHWVGRDTACDTWTVGYDAALSRWRDQAMPLPDQGTQVATLLAAHDGLSDRAMVLVGHSMGGLVIKTLVTQTLAAGNVQSRELVRRIRGVVFVATPHQGSQLATLAKAVAAVLRTNPQVGDMRLHDAHLRQLSAAFREQQPALHMKVAAFAESRDVVVKQRRWFGLLTRQFGLRVVDPSSSDPALRGVTTVPLAADHFSICKPSSRDDLVHRALVAFIADEIPARPPAAAALPRIGDPMAPAAAPSPMADRRPEEADRAAFGLPAPMDFGAHLDEKTNHFSGRRRLIAFIDRWFDEPAPRQRVMLIHAPFGIGKSALMAELFRRRRAAHAARTIFHACRYDREDTLEPGAIVRSIAAQLANHVPAYGAELKRNLALQALLEESSAMQRPAMAWARGVLEPLRALHGIDRPQQVHVLMVDGLDESGERLRSHGRRSLLDMIASARPNELPHWLRIVLASRPDDEVFARRGDFRFVDLLADPNCDNAADLVEYVERRCEELQAILVPHDLGRTRLTLIDAIVALCGGLFLVAEGVFRYVESDNYRPAAMRQLLDGATGLPGLDGFLDWSFHKRIAPQGFGAADTCAVLGVVAAARDPLPLQAVTDILRGEGAAPTIAHVHAIVRSLGGLLREERRRPGSSAPAGYTFAHKAIEDWLDPDSAASQADGRRKAGDYAIDRAAGTRAIRAHCLRLSSLAEPAVKAGAFAPYLERWGVEHLLDGEHLAAAARLIAARLTELPVHPQGDGFADGCRADETLVLDRLDRRFAEADAQRTDDPEIRALDSATLDHLLKEREYETGKYESVIRALLQYHPAAWQRIRSKLLKNDSDIVFRSDIGVAMAKAWHAAGGDDQSRLFDDIVALAGKAEGSAEREIAGYAIKHICQRIEPDPWWKPVQDALKAMIGRYAVSTSPTDRMVAGEALLALAVQGEPVFDWVGPEVGQFWRPHWSNLQADVDAARTLAALSARMPVPELGPAAATVLAQFREAQRLGRSLQAHEQFENGGMLCLRRALRETVWPQAHQQCGKAEIDDAFGILHEIAGDKPEGFVFDLVCLLMLHPLWDVTECGSNLLADLIKRSEGRRWGWIDALMACDEAHWRLRYGAVDAAYTAGRIDGYGTFLRVLVEAGSSTPRRDPYGRVRGICADDLSAYLERLSKERRLALLSADSPVAGLVRHWLRTADDIWLLEYLHALMSEIADGRSALPELAASLMPQDLAEALRPGNEERPFYALDAHEFLARVEARRAS